MSTRGLIDTNQWLKTFAHARITLAESFTSRHKRPPRARQKMSRSCSAFCQFLWPVRPHNRTCWTCPNSSLSSTVLNMLIKTEIIAPNH